MCRDQRRVNVHLRNLSFGLCSLILFTSSPAFSQPPQPEQIVHSVTLREMVVGSAIAGRDGIWQMYINPGSPYPFGNLGGTHIVDEVCLPNPTPSGDTGVYLSAGQGFGDQVAFTPGGSPFPLGEVDPSGKTELCNPLDTDDTWWFAYGNSLNLSPLLRDRFFGNEDTLQSSACDFLSTPVEGLVFLERRSADRQLSDLSCIDRDPLYPLRLGTLLICSFTGTWLDPAGNNLVPQLRKCERYLACTNAPFGPIVPLGQQCGVSTPPTPGPVPQPPAPVPPTPPPPTIQCNTTHGGGDEVPKTAMVELAQTTGTFQFDYETYTAKDQMIVSYEGTVLFDTGCVGTDGVRSQLISLPPNGTSTQVQVEVRPLCAGETTTQWSWTVHCPSGIGLTGLAGAWTGTFRRDDTGETGAVVTMFTEHNGQLGGWHFQESWVMENVAVSGNTVTFSHVYGQDCRAQHTLTVLNYETREAQSNYTVTCLSSGGHTGTITYRK